MAQNREAGWKATQNRQPLPPYETRVTGKPMMPTPSHKPVLSKAAPQGINPRILILELSAVAPTTPTTEVITPVVVEYDEKGTQEFDQVTIRSTVATEPGGTVDVEVAH